jgi:hypothetical protein
MSSQQPPSWKNLPWITAGFLILIATIFKPDPAECASAHRALHAWLIRLACAAAWALLSVGIANTATVVDSLRITPEPTTPFETPLPLDPNAEEKPRINFRLVVSFVMLVFIGGLLSNKTNLTAPLGSPENIASWLDVIISTAFWGMLAGMFAKTPRRNDASSAVDQAEERAMASPETKPKRKGIDRARWLMFAVFFGVCFAVSLWVNGGSLRVGQTWRGALEYWGKMLLMAAGLAFLGTPIPAMYSSGDPELLRITPARPKQGDLN